MDLQALQQQASRVIERTFSEGLSSLSDAERVLFLAWGYAGELDNGGHAQFFLNTMGDFTPETIEALHQLELHEQAELLAEAADKLFPDGVPRSMEERNDMVERTPDDGAMDRLLDDLDERFYALGGGDAVYRELSRRYVSDGVG